MKEGDYLKRFTFHEERVESYSRMWFPQVRGHRSGRPRDSGEGNDHATASQMP